MVWFWRVVIAAGHGLLRAAGVRGISQDWPREWPPARGCG